MHAKPIRFQIISTCGGIGARSGATKIMKRRRQHGLLASSTALLGCFAANSPPCVVRAYHSPETEDTAHLSCPAGFSGIQHRLDCRLMLFCDDGLVTYRHDCGEGMIFSMKHNACMSEDLDDAQCTTRSPTVTPTASRSSSPSSRPSSLPSTLPSLRPSAIPSISPSREPTSTPTTRPSPSPSRSPSFLPTSNPTNLPTLSDQTCPNNFNGLRSIKDCDQYVWCVEGEFFFGPMSCPRGMKFYLRKQACLIPEKMDDFVCL